MNAVQLGHRFEMSSEKFSPKLSHERSIVVSWNRYPDGVVHHRRVVAPTDDVAMTGFPLRPETWSEQVS